MRVRALTPADLAAAQRLREQAGWNQSDHDWHRLLAWTPEGCWAAERDGQVVGTTTVTTYGRRIAWIGMVLVDEDHRRQGIGRALLTHAIAYLDRLGVQTIALDSTPEGRPLYASLGFADAFELARWRGPILHAPQAATERATPDAPPAGSAAVPAAPGLAAGRGQGNDPPGSDSQIRPLRPADLPAVAAYDARLFGADRAHILAAQHAGHPRRCFLAERGGQVTGYVLSRPGARARHLGPLAADDPSAADALARRALLPDPSATPPADLLMDVVMPNADAVALATSLGLAAVRRFIRMTRGAPSPAVDLGRLYTSAGPELG